VRFAELQHTNACVRVQEGVRTCTCTCTCVCKNQTCISTVWVYILSVCVCNTACTIWPHMCVCVVCTGPRLRAERGRCHVVGGLCQLFCSSQRKRPLLCLVDFQVRDVCYMTCLNHVCDMTHSCVWHDLFI